MGGRCDPLNTESQHEPYQPTHTHTPNHTRTQQHYHVRARPHEYTAPPLLAGGTAFVVSEDGDTETESADDGTGPSQDTNGE